MRIFAALFHPILDNNARLILPVQTLYTDANPTAHLGSLSWPLCPCLRLFLLVIMRCARGATARDYKLSRRPRAHGNANRGRKRRMRRKRGNHALTSPLSLYQSTFSFTLIPVVENRLIGFQCFTGASLNAEGMVNNKRSQRIFRNGFWRTRRHWLCIFNATHLRLYIHAVMNAYHGNENR